MSADLESEIEILVLQGEEDPLSITRKLIERFGEEWARDEVAARAEDFITELARQAVSANRRRAELELVSGVETTSTHVKEAMFWIPEEGYRRGSELTSAMLRRKADYYQGLEIALRRRKIWCRAVADLMDAEGAVTLGDLDVPVPALPSEEDVLELVS